MRAKIVKPNGKNENSASDFRKTLFRIPTHGYVATICDVLDYPESSAFSDHGGDLFSKDYSTRTCMRYKEHYRRINFIHHVF